MEMPLLTYRSAGMRIAIDAAAAAASGLDSASCGRDIISAARPKPTTPAMARAPRRLDALAATPATWRVGGMTLISWRRDVNNVTEAATK